MGLFRPDLYLEKHEIFRKKINEANRQVLFKILEGYKSSLEHEEEKSGSSIEALEEQIEFLERLLLIHRKLEASSVKQRDPYQLHSGFTIKLDNDNLL